MSTHGGHAPNEKILPSHESNHCGPGFDVAAVTVEISAIGIHYK
jgi:hypothetical protein